MDRAWIQRCEDAVRQHAEGILLHGRDPLRQGVPLFCDGLELETLRPVTWLSQGETWVLSNLASQQHLLRLLEGVSVLTGAPAYVEAAEAAVGYMFEHGRVGELLSWGGHMAWDLAQQKPIFAANKGQMHELKRHYPYYALLHRVQPGHTERLIEAFWHTHVHNWSRLEFSRHGIPGEVPLPAAPWPPTYAEAPVFFEGVDLTFCNAGSDLYYAAAQQSLLTGQKEPLTWALRLLRRYAQTRHPETGLGGYQFSLSILPKGSPHVPAGRGDRAREQLGDQLAAFEPTEATVVSTKQLKTMLGPVAVCRLQLAEQLGAEGREFLDNAVQELRAWAHHAYDPEAHVWHPMLTQGLRLSAIVLEKGGYYGPAGSCLPTCKTDGLMTWAYALAFRLTRDEALWASLRKLVQGLKLGTLGETPEDHAELNLRTGANDPSLLMALLELHRATHAPLLMPMACQIANNILNLRWNHGLFVRQAHRPFFRLDRPEPLALLHLTETLRGTEGRLPRYSPGQPRFEAWHDLAGDTSDEKWLYDRVTAFPTTHPQPEQLPGAF